MNRGACWGWSGRYMRRYNEISCHGTDHENVPELQVSHSSLIPVMLLNQ